ncbi:MAG: hypothetical protein ABIR68_02680 [Ilumatobacteraceae bacterium]
MSAGAIPDAAQMRATLATWSTWLDQRTDRLLSLEERCRTAGSAADQADVAAAFVARKAIGDRLTATGDLVDRNRREAIALLGRPLVDGMGGPVGANIDDAAKLLEAIVSSVEQRIAGAELRQTVDLQQAGAIDADLAVAERLSRELGEQVNQVAQLRQQQSARRDPAALQAMAAKVRAGLEATDRERQRVLAAFAVAGDRVQRLTAQEAEVRALAERCREKVLGAPLLAVPSVAAIGSGPAVAELNGLPWQAARTRIEPFVVKLDRVERALDEAARRFGTPLAERDDLRGLLQSYRSKAGAHGFSEDALLEPLYRRAEAVLWSAPCDLDIARPLVQEYSAGVNARLGQGSTGVPR